MSRESARSSSNVYTTEDRGGWLVMKQTAQAGRQLANYLRVVDRVQVICDQRALVDTIEPRTFFLVDLYQAASGCEWWDRGDVDLRSCPRHLSCLESVRRWRRTPSPDPSNRRGLLKPRGSSHSRSPCSSSSRCSGPRRSSAVWKNAHMLEVGYRYGSME